MAAVLVATLLGLQLALNARVFVAEVFAASGEAARSAGDFPGAAACFRRALACEPFQPDLAYKLGIACTALNDLEGARKAFRTSLRYGPNAVHTLLAAAQTEARLGDLDAARSDVAQAKRLLPRYWRVAFAAAALEGQDSEALRNAEELLTEALPTLTGAPRFECVYDLGIVLKQMEYLEEAAARLQEAVSLDPSRLDARAALADTLAALGRTDEAASLYRSLVANPALDTQSRHALTKRLGELQNNR